MEHHVWHALQELTLLQEQVLAVYVLLEAILFQIHHLVHLVLLEPIQ